MVLDLRTVYVVCAAACVVLGIVQLLAYSTGRFERWPAWWGLSNLLVGIGTFAVAMRGIAPDIVSVDLANIVTLAGYILLPVATRAFAGERIRPGRYVLAFMAGALPLVLFFSDASSYAARIAYLSLFLGGFDLAVAREGMRLARREGLASAWILVFLFVPTALIFAVRSFLAATGRLDSGAGLFDRSGGPHQWIALSASVFVCLRGVAIVLMASERSRNRLIDLANHDPLTGALNRSGLAAAFARLSARRKPVACLLVDVDHFKAINDTHGHAAGDRILQSFAATARAEAGPGAIMARYGGDEFVVLLEGADVAGAVDIAESMRKAFHETAQYEIAPAVVATLSIGVAAGRAGSDSLADILQRADEAVYRSKHAGRDRVEAHWSARDAA